MLSTPEKLRLVNVQLAAIIAALGTLSFIAAQWAPALPWLFPFLALVTLAGQAVQKTSASERRILAVLMGFVVLTHVAVLLGRLQYNPAIDTFWRDDRDYFIQSAALAEAWKAGIYPDISRKGSELYYLGTLHTGYHRPLASILFLFGPSPTAGLFINLLCAAVMPLLAFLLVRELDLLDRAGDPSTGLSPPIIAAALTALHPAQLYWTQFLLKDTHTAFWFVACLWLAVSAFQRRDVAAALALMGALYILFTLRIYAAASIVLAIMTYLLLYLRRSVVWGAAGIFVPMIALASAYTDGGWKRFDQMWSSFVELGPKPASPWAMIGHLLAGIPRLLLGPYSWIEARSAQPMYGLYPAMWFLYLVVYPAAFIGFAYAVRHNRRIATLPIVAGLAGAMVLLTASYAGSAPRQRYYMEYICIAFAAYGYRLPKRRTFIIWYLILGTYMIGQVITVWQRGL